MKTYFNDNKGLTLVEVLASTVLITLLLTTFLMMFAQAAKTNVASETIVDSTYIAQAEMEQIYASSKRLAPANKSAAFPAGQYGSPDSRMIDGTKWQEYNKTDTASGSRIKIRLEEAALTAKMTRIVIEVYEGTKANPSAKMENVLVWEGASS